MSPILVPRRLRSDAGGIPPRLTPRVVWSLLGETLLEWYEDRAPRLGAALAYYTVFALAPGLILIIALTALVLGKAAAQSQIIGEMQDLVGVAGAQAIRAAIESAGSAGEQPARHRPRRHHARVRTVGCLRGAAGRAEHHLGRHDQARAGRDRHRQGTVLVVHGGRRRRIPAARLPGRQRLAGGVRRSSSPSCCRCRRR